MQTLYKILRWFAWDFWVSRVQLFIFCHFFQISNGLLYFDKTLKYLVYVKIFHEAKLQALVEMQMTLNQTSTLQNRMIFRELNSVVVTEGGQPQDYADDWR